MSIRPAVTLAVVGGLAIFQSDSALSKGPPVGGIAGEVNCFGLFHISTGGTPTPQSIELKLKIDHPSKALVKGDDEWSATASVPIRGPYALRVDASTWHGGRQKKPWFNASAKLFAGSRIVGVGFAQGEAIVTVPKVARPENATWTRSSGVVLIVINTEALSSVSTDEPLLSTNSLGNIPYELARATPSGTVTGTDRLTCNLFAK